ncbi:MAG: DUF357 domain-containing protein [Methanotrichaceae archaeon]|nr:DUF357 domain-containing protein [Methanotrichaceae archaeon]
MSLDEDLREETLKWLTRAEELFSRISGEEPFCDNIAAYLQDSRYFLQQGDLIRAFEAVVWAWAWMEIGLEMKVLSEGAKED